MQVRAVDAIVEPDYPAIRTTPVYGMCRMSDAEPAERCRGCWFRPTDPIAGSGSLFDPVVPGPDQDRFRCPRVVLGRRRALPRRHRVGQDFIVRLRNATRVRFSYEP